MIHIYDCNETFLYEIIEKYKELQTQEQKDEVFSSFCSAIWSCGNKRRTYKKAIRFKVAKNLLGTPVGQVFDAWSMIEYKYYKSVSKNQNWCSIIRQKINNIYTKYFDKEVILNKEYMDLLKKPKQLYYKWASGVDMTEENATSVIDDIMDKALTTKERFQKEKMTLSWNEYKIIIEGFLRKCFDNCKLIDEYEDKTKLVNNFDFITEDHFYVKYINRSLSYYIRNYQKEYYGVKRGHNNKYTRCKQCGALIEKTGNKKMYCGECKRKNDLIRYKKYNEKRNTTNRKA